MTHTNKSNTSNTKTYLKDLKNKENRDKNKNIDNFGLFFLFLVGIVGFFYASKSMFPKSNNADPYIIEEPLPDNRKGKTKKGPFVSKKQKNEEVLSIEGMRETDTDISFMIKGYNPDALYILDFGDGEQQVIKSNEITYQYSRAGSYTVNLILKYGEKAERLFSKELNIATAPEILKEYMDEYIDN